MNKAFMRLVLLFSLITLPTFISALSSSTMIAFGVEEQNPVFTLYGAKDPNPSTQGIRMTWQTSEPANVTLDMHCTPGTIKFTTDKGNHPSCEKGGVWNWENQNFGTVIMYPSENTQPVTVEFELRAFKNDVQTDSEVMTVTFPQTTNSQESCLKLQNDFRYRTQDTSANKAVFALQNFLRSKGYLDSESTGYFGLLTFKAVKDFQSANAISPTGYIGPMTRARIQALSCGGVTIPTPPISSVTDKTDFEYLVACLLKNTTSSTECAKANFNGDTIVNSLDLGLLKSAIKYDLAGDSIVDLRDTTDNADFSYLQSCLLKNTTSSTECAKADFNRDAIVNSLDLGLFKSAIKYDLTGDGRVDLRKSTVAPVISNITAKAASTSTGEIDAGELAYMHGTGLGGKLTVRIDTPTPQIIKTTGVSDTYATFKVPSRKRSTNANVTVTNAVGAVSNSVPVHIIVPLPIIKPKISITYPLAGYRLDNSGTRGDGNSPIATIEWNQRNGDYPVNIYLLDKNENVVRTIAQNIPDTGSFVWGYDPTLSNGSYQLEIALVGTEGDNIVHAYSGYFTIDNAPLPTLTITYPNGGEQLDNSGENGAIATILWNSNNMGSLNVSVLVQSTSGTDWYKEIALCIPNTGSFVWPHDPSIPNGSYQIGIHSCDKGASAVDSSNAAFQIINSSYNTDFGADLAFFKSCFQKNTTSSIECAGTDFNGDTMINTLDLAILRSTLKYDLTGDNIIDLRSTADNADLNYLKSCLLKNIASSTECAKANFNGDTIVNSLDLGLFKSAIKYDFTGDSMVDLRTSSGSVLGAYSENGNADFSYRWEADFGVGSSRTADVSALQRALTFDGVYFGEITGGYYEKTRAAVKLFQEKYFIEQTGFAGPNTRSKLNQLFGNR